MEKCVEQGGTTQSKVGNIKECMWLQFCPHRIQLKVDIQDRVLIIWAMDKAFEMSIPNVKAAAFILYFKNECKITSRRMTQIVTKENLFADISLKPIIDKFWDNFQKMINQYNCNSKHPTS